MNIQDEIDQIAGLRKEQSDLRFSYHHRLEEITKKLLYACGPVEMNGVTYSVEQNYESVNLYQSRTVKRGCCKWVKKESAWSGTGYPLVSAYDRFSELINYILSNGLLTRALEREQGEVNRAQEKMAGIQDIHSKLFPENRRTT